MPITKIELVGYRRLSLNNIQRIEISMTERLQLILGTNGSGKSSLVRELSPLPAHPANYTKTGSKIVYYEHQGHEYVLSSTMHPSVRHSFKKNQHELNPGGTQSVQRELVFQHFGITPEIHNLLTNKERFTQMSPRRRRDWFTLLSDVNYDYALQVFARLRERAKQLNGSVVLAKKRLVVEAGRLISEEEQHRIRLEIEALHHELEILQSERAPMTLNPHELVQTEARLADTLLQLEQKVLRLRVTLFGKVPFGSMDEIDQQLLQWREREVAVKALLEQSVKEHEQLEKQVMVLREAGEEGLRELAHRRLSLQSQREDILRERRFPTLEIDPLAGMGALQAARDNLMEIFIHLPINEEKRFSNQRFMAESERKLRLIDQKARLEREYTDVLSKARVMASHKQLGSTCCPKCGHTWIAGYSDTEYAQLNSRLETLGVDLKQVETETGQCQSELEAINAYRIQYASLMRTFQAFPVLRPFWDELLESQIILNNPRKGVTYLEYLEHDLNLGRQAAQLQAEIDKINTLCEQAKNLEHQNLEQVSARLFKSDEAIATYTQELATLAQQQSTTLTLKRNLTEYLSLGEKITQVLDSLQTNGQEQIEALRLEAIHTSIRQVQIALAQRTKQLSEIDLQKRTISDLEANIAEMELQEQVAKQLISDLSPTDGLIADGLMGSINACVNEMNAIIRKIWSYPITIEKCGTSTEEGAELDYKFPMTVINEPVEDVGEGSTGQQEIVDLAFRIVAMRRLGLVEPPLMLDEFGAGFDEAHRKSAAFAIQNLVEQQMFSQVFMVSHYEASYGALTQCEILALCTDNITLPAGGKYNQHVTIEN